jgi:uncharacterized protein
MIDQQKIIAIDKLARTYFEGASVCHDWSHVERVKNLALYIGEKEGADLQIVEVSALLHDIGRKQEFACKGKNTDGQKFCHAIEGAKEAEKILQEFGFEKDDIDNIVHCIETHRFRNEHIPETLEAKVLFDSDKLDSIGAVGVARTFIFAGHFNTAMYTGKEKEQVVDNKNYDFTKDDTAVLEYEKKLKHVKDKMQTKTGKKIALERDKFMKDFFKRFWSEVNGEK